MVKGDRLVPVAQEVREVQGDLGKGIVYIKLQNVSVFCFSLVAIGNVPMPLSSRLGFVRIFRIVIIHELAVPFPTIFCYFLHLGPTPFSDFL